VRSSAAQAGSWLRPCLAAIQFLPPRQRAVLILRDVLGWPADVAAFTALLTEDARQAMPPYLWWYEGRDAVATIFARYIDPGSPDYPGHLRLVPTAANRQPAAAGYLRRPGDTEYRLFGLDVLEVQDGLVAGIVSFGVDLLAAFGLPQTL
jgi:RNA polymerase sigma-70 factor, ECF subfamily